MREQLPTLNDVYMKFGEVSEAAQLLETELGNMLLFLDGVDANLHNEPNSEVALDLIQRINRQSLGQLIKNANSKGESMDGLEELLSNALKERNRLSHSFYRQHNFRRNSAEGCLLMLQDLKAIHEVLWKAYKAVMLLSGIDLNAVVVFQPPIRHRAI